MGPTVRLVDAHVSGWHSAGPSDWQSVLLMLEDLGTESAGATECLEWVESLTAWRQYLPPGPTAAECTVLWRADRFRRSASGTSWLTRKTFRTGSGHVRPGVVATWVLLTDRDTDQRLLRLVAHLPASVQDGDRFSRDQAARVAAWVAALDGLRATLKRLTMDLDPDMVVVSCDWNVDVARLHWRTLINTALRPVGLRLSIPPAGTLHDRRIDAHASRRRGHVRVLPKRKPFDHRPVLTVFSGAR